MDGGRRPYRKRGRPAGKNRQPLNEEEKKARNAFYERERRVELGEAFRDLAESAGLDTSLPNSKLIVEVIQFIKRSRRGRTIAAMRRQNEYIQAQILDMEKRLGGVTLGGDGDEPSNSNSDDEWLNTEEESDVDKPITEDSSSS